MLDRVEQFATADARRIWGGTFHSVANRLLRSHAEHHRLPAKLHDPRRRGREGDDERRDRRRRHPDAWSAASRRETSSLDIHSHVINTRESFEQYVEDNFPHFLMYLAEMRTVFRHYGERKLRANSMDFDDLLVNWKRLLDENERGRRGPEAAVPPHPRRRVPGHEQAPGGDRRPDVVGAAQRDGRRRRRAVDLLVPRRLVREHPHLPPPVRGLPHLQAGDELPLHARDPRRWRTPRSTTTSTSSRRSCGRSGRAAPSPASSASTTSTPQALFIAQRILELRDEGESLEDIAVLYRSHYQSLELQMELSRRNIPYVIRSGVRFFEQAHVKDVIAYLRVVLNPKDELSWMRILKLYPKVGDRTARAIWDAISRTSDPLHAFLGGATSGVRATAKSLENLRSTLRALISEAMRRAAAEAIRLIVDEGYGDYVRTKFPNFSARLDDLEQLAIFAQKLGSVEELLEELSLANPDRRRRRRRRRASRTRKSCSPRCIRRRASSGDGLRDRPQRRQVSLLARAARSGRDRARAGDGSEASGERGRDRGAHAKAHEPPTSRWPRS